MEILAEISGHQAPVSVELERDVPTNTPAEIHRRRAIVTFGSKVRREAQLPRRERIRLETGPRMCFQASNP